MCSTVHHTLTPMPTDTCFDYLGWSSSDEDEDPILESIQFQNTKFILTWDDSSPAVQFLDDSGAIVSETIESFDSLSFLEKQLLNADAHSLDNIARIVNHLCNVEGQVYNLVHHSAELTKNGSLTFKTIKSSVVYRVTVLSFQMAQVYYTTLPET